MEDLINKLRAHLARLTSELASNRELLTELRTLRDADATTLKEKSAEITRLRNEVERLAGEVEVLRNVVEEGLRERRAAKEASLQQESVQGEQISYRDPSREHFAEENDPRYEMEEEEDEDDGEEDLETETEDAAFSSVSGGSRIRAMDKTMRTDHATEGSSLANGTRTRFMDPADLERISAEIDERRSDRSGSVNLSQFSHSRSPVQSPSPRSRRSRTMGTSVAYDMSTVARRASSPDSIPDPEEELQELAENEVGSIPLEAGPSTRASADYVEDRNSHTNRGHRSEVEAPFPKIRGKHLERLFFAAPEHDARTCTTCNRRRESDGHPVSPLSRTRRAARRARPRHRADDQDDEGFAEGSEELEESQAQNRDKGKRRERSLQDINEVPSIARQEGLPPQTIVARIIRELEDDFTHYKR